MMEFRIRMVLWVIFQVQRASLGVLVEAAGSRGQLWSVIS